MKSKEYIEDRYNEFCYFANHYSPWEPLFEEKYTISEVETLIELLEEILEISKENSYFYEEKNENN